MIWNDTVMFDRIGSNDLKSENVRFRFEYSSISLANRLYIDNIRIGEESDLLINSNSNEFRLNVFPNPITDNTNPYVSFETLKEGNINIRICNVLGTEVKSIIDETLNKGSHSKELNLKDIKEGVYFITIMFDGNVMKTTKLIVQ